MQFFLKQVSWVNVELSVVNFCTLEPADVFSMQATEPYNKFSTYTFKRHLRCPVGIRVFIQPAARARPASLIFPNLLRYNAVVKNNFVRLTSLNVFCLPLLF